MGETNQIAEVVDSLHDFLENKQVGSDIAIVSLISTAGEVALGMIVARPEQKDAYLKSFNSAVEQVRKQLNHELKARRI